MDFYAVIFLLMLIAPIVYMYSAINKHERIERKHFVTTLISAVIGMAFFPIIFFTAVKNTYTGSIWNVIFGAVAAGIIWGIICIVFLWIIKKWLKK